MIVYSQESKIHMPEFALQPVSRRVAQITSFCFRLFVFLHRQGISNPNGLLVIHSQQALSIGSKLLFLLYYNI